MAPRVHHLSAPARTGRTPLPCVCSVSYACDGMYGVRCLGWEGVGPCGGCESGDGTHTPTIFPLKTAGHTFVGRGISPLPPPVKPMTGC